MTPPAADRRRFRYLRDPVFLAAVALHFVNRFAVRPFTGDPNDFWHCWLNDLVCVPFWLPPLLWVLRVLDLRRHDAPPTVLELLEMVVLWSAIFEWLVPSTRLSMYFPLTVGDPIDVAMYATGAAIAGLLWRSGGRGPAVEPPHGPAVGQHRLVAALLVFTTAAGAVLLLLLLAASSGMTFEHASLWRARSDVNWVANYIVDAQRRTGSLPTALDVDFPASLPRERFLYRPESEQFVLIDLGSDHALGGTGDAADLWWPQERQPPDPPWTWLYWPDTRLVLVASALLSTFAARRWLLHRRRRDPPYERMSAVAWAVLVFRVIVPIGFAMFVLFLQYGFMVSTQNVH